MRITHFTDHVAIITPNSPKSNSENADNTVIKHTVETLDGEFELFEGESLLDALLRTGHQVEFQCRSGYCGACRTQKISGEVTYDDYPLAHLNDDEILPCCCRVTTSPLHLAVQRQTADDKRQGELFNSSPKND